MSTTVKYILAFIISLLISTLLVPLVKKIAWKFNIFALENERTVHHGKIARIGGVAVFIAFVSTMLIFYQPMEKNVYSMLIGAAVIFVGGLLDDIFDLRAWQKIIFQTIGAVLYIVVGGINIEVIYLPFGISINLGIFGYLFTYLWILGITNAINLLDGLDGLSSGFTIIVLATISLINNVNDYKAGVLLICMLMIGAIIGFLFYNCYPASIFIGDCGAQFMGFMIAAVSLQGYKSGTTITMMIPLILLFLPIMDVFSAIVRRKIQHKKFSDPDKGHFHHQLMKLFGTNQRNTVLVIYIITAIFGVTAYIYAIDNVAGLMMLVILFIAYDFFVELTGMASTKYRPILTLLDKIENLKRKNK